MDSSATRSKGHLKKSSEDSTCGSPRKKRREATGTEISPLDPPLGGWSFLGGARPVVPAAQSVSPWLPYHPRVHSNHLSHPRLLQALCTLPVPGLPSVSRFLPPHCVLVGHPGTSHSDLGYPRIWFRTENLIRYQDCLLSKRWPTSLSDLLFSPRSRNIPPKEYNLHKIVSKHIKGADIGRKPTIKEFCAFAVFPLPGVSSS